jgi:hypothetical protein
VCLARPTTRSVPHVWLMTQQRAAYTGFPHRHAYRRSVRYFWLFASASASPTAAARSTAWSASGMPVKSGGSSGGTAGADTVAPDARASTSASSACCFALMRHRGNG